MMLNASERIDKCPTPGQRFSDKFPTVGTDKVTSGWQNAQGRMGMLGIEWAIREATIRDGGL